MSSRLNLNDNITDVFEFTIGGKDYDFKYPTMEQLQPIAELNEKREKAVKDGADTTEIDEEIERVMYGMVIPVGHDTPIKETLKTQPFPVVRAFNEMMAKQLSAE